MKVFLIGAGQVGSTILEALHSEHELTVLDTEQARLQAVADRYDVSTYEGDGTSRRDLSQAGAGAADLFLACTSRDEVNLVAGMFARREAPSATTVIRTSNVYALNDPASKSDFQMRTPTQALSERKIASIGWRKAEDLVGRLGVLFSPILGVHADHIWITKSL